MMAYRDLFLSFLLVGAVGFGGGYAMLPLIRHEVVDRNAWLAGGAFSDLVALSQMTPGPISLNAATYVGIGVAGVGGALLATAAVCATPFVLSILCTRGYERVRHNRRVRGAMRALKPVVVGLVAAAALSLVNRDQFPDYRAALVFAGVFALALATRWHPALLLLLAGFTGWLIA